MAMSPGEITQWIALVGTAGTGAVIWLRAYTKMKIANKVDATNSEISNQLLTNLRDEIKRLEGIIKEMGEQLKKMNTNIESIRNLEMQGAADFGCLEEITKNMPCLECVNQGTAFKRLYDTIERIRQKREARHALMGLDIKAQP